MNFPYPRQSGVSMIEVLVAVLVLSIGVLGLAALQARALSSNGGSMNQTMATVAAYSVLEAMRVDRVNAVAGSYNKTVTTGDSTGKNTCPTDTSTLANQQLKDWCTLLASSLGTLSTTSGTIACTAANASCLVTVQFDDSKSIGGGSTQKIVIQAGL